MANIELTSRQLNEIAEAIAERLGLYHKEFLSVREAATYLNVRIYDIYTLMKTKEIRHSSPMGEDSLIPWEDLDDWLRSNRFGEKSSVLGKRFPVKMKRLYENYLEAKKNGTSISKFAKNYGVSTSYVYLVIRRFERMGI